MPIEDLLRTFNSEMWVVVKIMVLVVLLIYLAFSILAVRQAQLMTRTLTGKLDRHIHVISWGFFTLVVVLFLVVLLFL